MPVRPSAVFQFATSGGYGWSERYWYQVVAAPLIDVAATAKVLWDKRMKCCASNVQPLNGYVSYEDVFRDSEPILPVPSMDKAINRWNDKFVIEQDNSDMPWTSVDVRFWSGTYGNKHIFLCGCPDADLVVPPKQATPIKGTLYDAVKVWADEVCKNWAWLGRATDPAISPKTDITNVAGDVDGTSIVTVTSTAGFKPGRPCKISGAEWMGAVSPNRNWDIAEVPTNTTFRIKTYGVSLGWTGGGSAQCLNAGLFPCTKWKIVGTTNRKRGGGPARLPSARKRR